MALHAHLKVVKRRAAVRARAVIWQQRAPHGTVPRAVPMAHILLSLLLSPDLMTASQQMDTHSLSSSLWATNLGIMLTKEGITACRTLAWAGLLSWGHSLGLSPAFHFHLLFPHQSLAHSCWQTGKMPKCPPFIPGEAVLGWNSQNKEMEAACWQKYYSSDSLLILFLPHNTGVIKRRQDRDAAAAEHHGQRNGGWRPGKPHISAHGPESSSSALHKLSPSHFISFKLHPPSLMFRIFLL